VVHDFVDGDDTYPERPGATWQADLAFASVAPAEYAALVIPGGRAPEHIRNDTDLQRIVQRFFGEAKPAADLCHAPLVLAAAGVLGGRKTAAYPALAPMWPRPGPSSSTVHGTCAMRCARRRHAALPIQSDSGLRPHGGRL
jgi:putative intracellular protease/amidase